MDKDDENIFLKKTSDIDRIRISFIGHVCAAKQGVGLRFVSVQQKQNRSNQVGKGIQVVTLNAYVEVMTHQTTCTMSLIFDQMLLFPRASIKVINKVRLIFALLIAHLAQVSTLPLFLFIFICLCNFYSHVILQTAERREM